MTTAADRHALQDLLARMATDPALAAEVLRDPAAAATRHGLSEDEVTSLRSVRLGGVDRRPTRLEERISRSALVFGGELHTSDSGGDPGGDSGSNDSGDSGSDHGGDSSSSDSSDSGSSDSGSGDSDSGDSDPGAGHSSSDDSGSSTTSSPAHTTDTTTHHANDSETATASGSASHTGSSTTDAGATTGATDTTTGATTPATSATPPSEGAEPMGPTVETPTHTETTPQTETSRAETTGAAEASGASGHTSTTEQASTSGTTTPAESGAQGLGPVTTVPVVATPGVTPHATLASAVTAADPRPTATGTSPAPDTLIDYVTPDSAPSSHGTPFTPDGTVIGGGAGSDGTSVLEVRQPDGTIVTTTMHADGVGEEVDTAPNGTITQQYSLYHPVADGPWVRVPLDGGGDHDVQVIDGPRPADLEVGDDLRITTRDALPAEDGGLLTTTYQLSFDDSRGFGDPTTIRAAEHTDGTTTTTVSSDRATVTTQRDDLGQVLSERVEAGPDGRGFVVAESHGNPFVPADGWVSGGMGSSTGDHGTTVTLTDGSTVTTTLHADGSGEQVTAAPDGHVVARAGLLRAPGQVWIQVAPGDGVSNIYVGNLDPTTTTNVDTTDPGHLSVTTTTRPNPDGDVYVTQRTAAYDPAAGTVTHVVTTTTVTHPDGSSLVSLADAQGRTTTSYDAHGHATGGSSASADGLSMGVWGTGSADAQDPIDPFAIIPGAVGEDLGGAPDTAFHSLTLDGSTEPDTAGHHGHHSGGASDNPFVRPEVTPAVAAAVAASASNYHGGVLAQQVGVDGATVRYTYGDGTSATAARTTDPATGQITDTITRDDGATLTHAWDPAQGPATGLWQTSAPDGTSTSFNEADGVAYGHTDRPDGATVDLQITTPSAANDQQLLTISETGPEPDFAQTGITVHGIDGYPESAYATVQGPDGTTTTINAELRYTDNPDGSRTTTILYRDGDSDSFTTLDGHVVDHQSVRHDGTVLTDPDAPAVNEVLPDPVEQVVDRGVANDHGRVVGSEDLYENLDGSTTARLTYADGTTAEFTRHTDVPNTQWHDETVRPDGTEVVQYWSLGPGRVLTAGETVTTHPDGSVTTLTYTQPRDNYLADFTETTRHPDGSTTEFIGYKGYLTPNDRDGGGYMQARSIETDAAGRTTVTTYATVPESSGVVAIVEGPDGSRTVTPVWFDSRTVGEFPDGAYDVVYTFVRPDGGTETVALGQQASDAFDSFSAPEVQHWSTPPATPSAPGTQGTPAPDQNIAFGDTTALPTDGTALVVSPDAGGEGDFATEHPYLPRDPDARYTVEHDADGNEISTVEGPGDTQVRTIAPDGTGTRVDWDPDPYGDRGGPSIVATWTIERQPNGYWLETKDGDSETGRVEMFYAPDGAAREVHLAVPSQLNQGPWSPVASVTTSYPGGLVQTYEHGQLTRTGFPHDDGGWTELTRDPDGHVRGESYSGNGTLLWTSDQTGPTPTNIGLETSYRDAEGHLLGGTWAGNGEGTWGTVPSDTTPPTPPDSFGDSVRESPQLGSDQYDTYVVNHDGSWTHVGANFNQEAGSPVGPTSTTVHELDGSYTETVTNRQGTTSTHYDAQGHATSGGYRSTDGHSGGGWVGGSDPDDRHPAFHSLVAEAPSEDLGGASAPATPTAELDSTQGMRMQNLMQHEGRSYEAVSTIMASNQEVDQTILGNTRGSETVTTPAQTETGHAAMASGAVSVPAVVTPPVAPMPTALPSSTPAADPNAGYHGGVVRSAPTTNADGSQTVHVRYGDGTTIDVDRTTDPATGGRTDTWTEPDGTTATHTVGPDGFDVTVRTAPDGTITAEVAGESFASDVTRSDGTWSQTAWGPTDSTPTAIFSTVDHLGGDTRVDTVVTPTASGGYLATVTSSDGSVETVRVTAQDVDNPDGSTTRIFTFPDGDTDAFTTDVAGRVVHHESHHADDTTASWADPVAPTGPSQQATIDPATGAVTTTVENPDGHRITTTTGLDGSDSRTDTAPDGSWSRTSDDGRGTTSESYGTGDLTTQISMKKADGAWRTAYLDETGLTTWEMTGTADGTTTETQYEPNGSWSRYMSRPDGTRVETVGYEGGFTDGSYTVYDADGAGTTYAGNGTTTVVHPTADGGTEHVATATDGTVSTMLFGPDGSVTQETVIGPDGTGTRTYHLPDDHARTVIVTRGPDGQITEYRPPAPDTHQTGGTEVGDGPAPDPTTVLTSQEDHMVNHGQLQVFHYGDGHIEIFAAWEDGRIVERSFATEAEWHSTVVDSWGSSTEEDSATGMTSVTLYEHRVYADGRHVRSVIST